MSTFYYQDDYANEDQPRIFAEGTLIPYCQEYDTLADVMDCACSAPGQGCKMSPCRCQCHLGRIAFPCNEQ